MEGTLPACLVEDMDENVAHEAQPLANALLVNLIGGSFKGPVDEHGTANDVLARHKAPESSIEALGPIVAHGEHLAGRNDEVAIDDVIGKLIGPACRYLIVGARRNSGKVVTIGVERVLGIFIFGRHTGVRLILRDA